MTSAALAQQPEQEVDVDDLGTVTLTVKDTDLAQVLEMLAIQSRKNIITSKNVSGAISANLYDVTFYEALDAILRVNGYGYVEEGNFIYVYTGPELEEIQRSTRRTESRVYELEHLSATDAFEFITPLLSEAGRASFRGDVPTGFKPDIADGGADSYAFIPRVVVNDFPENLDDIAELLSDLDTAPQQVLVESTIVQAQLDEANAFGIDFALIGDVDFLDLTRPLAGVDNLLNGSDESNGFQPEDNKAFTSQSTVGNTSGEGGLKVGIMSNDFAIFLRVLDEVTDSVVLARPKIMCLNRQRAEVLVGARVGFLSTTATETSTTQSVEFLDTGIQLVFRPFIGRNGMIRMELAPSVSEASLRSVTDANGLIVTIPDELTNELTTNVRVPDGQTLVLGGLFRESTRVTRRQVPVMGDIPVIGALFKGIDDTVDRSEIIFMITPTIIEDNLLGEFGAETLSYIEAARVGIRAGLLPFSRERMVDGYNQEAIQAYERGDIEKALYYANSSLRSRPLQPEMIRFREQITGARDGLHEQDLMERILRRKLGATISRNPDPEVTHRIPATPPAFLGVNTIVPPEPIEETPVEPTGEQHWVAPADPRKSADASQPMQDDDGLGEQTTWQPSGQEQSDQVVDGRWPGPAWEPVGVYGPGKEHVTTMEPIVSGTDVSTHTDEIVGQVEHEVATEQWIVSGSDVDVDIATGEGYEVISQPIDTIVDETNEIAVSEWTESSNSETTDIAVTEVPVDQAQPASFDDMQRAFLQNRDWPQPVAPSTDSSVMNESPSETSAASGLQFDTFDTMDVVTSQLPQDQAMEEATDVASTSTESTPAVAPTPTNAVASVSGKSDSTPTDEQEFSFDSFEKAVRTKDIAVRREVADASEEGLIPFESFDVEEPAGKPIEVVEVPVTDTPNN